ncbi:glycosyltransferase [Microbacterium lacus]|uniref:glycosyltransferase n=1 Tax=Microbacterium lacus TaxID=415217 RepID=UPI000C2CDCCB|nr:glycosyltransferase [Microbacterium lacus]
MTARLRVVLDQVVSRTSPDLTEASTNLVGALIDSAPSGCDVAGILPASRPVDAQPSSTFEALANVWTAAVPRRELAAAWRMGAALGSAGGMIHSPTLMAPLVRHDRAHDHDQTVVTLWSLEAWTSPENLDRADAAWQRAMLKRAVRFADAVVVPTHAMAAELDEIASFGGRIRVIAGAPPKDFRIPVDAPGRVRALALPDQYVVVLGRASAHNELAPALRAAAGTDLHVVIADADEGDTALLADQAVSAGLLAERVHPTPTLATPDRAALLGSAGAVIAMTGGTMFPWRTLEALAIGAPVVAVRTAQNEELLADGAHLVGVGDSDGIAEALRRVMVEDSFSSRLRVLAAARARAFSWRDAAERVWQLHAEL